jgi:suppressor for copper-sensitivity B
MSAEMMGRWRIAGLVAAFAWLTLAGGARAAEPGASAWFETAQGAVRLIAASPTVGSGSEVRLGLQFRLAPHWKIYWRSPGDAGYPPAVDWTGSSNLARTAISWPAPKRFSVSGLETVGYENGVVLPVLAWLRKAGRALSLRAKIDYLTCKELCIPHEAALRLDLPAGASAAGGFAGLISTWEARVPKPDGALRIAAASIVGGSSPYLDVRVSGDRPLSAPDVFVEGLDPAVFGRPALVSHDGNQTILQLPLLTHTAAPTFVGRRATLTLVDGSLAAERQLVLAAGTPSSDATLLWRMVALALLGGFILNFMPCVLPVLSIKLLAAVEQAGRPLRAIRLGFLASAAGILFSFLLLAGVMVGLRTAGVAIGWGIQFQQPLFIAAMVSVLTLFACNLWGLFEVPLPQFVAGSARLGGDGLAGNFAAGALATLLATPCSAPFLGTAVGFALASGAAQILAIFLALGVGLALPYLLVAAVPKIARQLPRPGRWMVMLRRLLGIALGATAAWLLAVLAAQSGAGAALAVGLLMGALTVALAIFRKARLRRVAAAAIVAAALVVPLLPASGPAAASDDSGWKRFDRAAIARLVGEGKTVFVDVTADWCLTCKVNERLVLDAAPVRRLLAASDVVAMRADWTRPNPAIADYLRSFGRYGVPFNAVYGPGAPFGVPLSEILTEGAVSAALRRAAGAPSSRSVAEGG